MSTSSVVSPVSSSTVSPKRYHPALVALHWLIAILIFAAFFLAHGGEGEGEGRRFRPEGGQGNFPQQGVQQNNPNFQPGNPPQGGFPQQATQSIFSIIGWHMMVGIIVLVLLIIRVLVRFATKHPEWQS